MTETWSVGGGVTLKKLVNMSEEVFLLSCLLPCPMGQLSSYGGYFSPTN